MIWSFERGGQSQRCEIRRDADGQIYEFVITKPDGVEQSERFDEPSALIARSVEYLRALIEDGWRSPNQR
ncbi:MAG TPA: hypothetical protein VGK32_11725 [Vicinamibacterales bacterium]|jgi:hypothetical protein